MRKERKDKGQSEYSIVGKKKKLSNRNLLLSIPSNKTVFLTQYHMYMTYAIANLQKVLDFYGFETVVGRFRCYQRVYSAREELVNTLINDGKKHKEEPQKKKGEKGIKEKKKKGEERSESYRVINCNVLI